MRKVMQLKVSVDGTQVWRRILVSANLSLRKAHGVLREALGWEGIGSYCFQQDGRVFGNPALHSDYVEDDAAFGLRYCLCLPGQSLEYVWGRWRHTIVLEDIGPGEAKSWRLVAGEGSPLPARVHDMPASAASPILH